MRGQQRTDASGWLSWLPMALTITVLEGDETGQELLEQALRVLESGRRRPRRRARALRPVAREPPGDGQRGRPRGRARDARGRPGHQGRDDHARGQGRRRLAQPHPPRGGRRQGDHPHRPPHPRRHAGRRRAPTRSPSSAWRSRTPTAPSSGARASEGAGDEVAYRTEKITRSTCRAVAEYAFRTAEKMGGKVYGGPKWTVSPVYEGMLKEELDAAAARHPDVAYQPVLIDATYAGLISGAADDAAGHPRAQPRRRLPLGPRHADVRLDRRRRVRAAGLRRRPRRSTSPWPRRRTGPRRRCRARTSPTRWP